MNEDFYYFFSLFKDNCVFNEALNCSATIDIGQS